jgi:type II secretory pathway component PulF
MKYFTMPRKTIKPESWQNWMGQWSELILSGMPVLDALALGIELQGNSRQGLLLRTGLQKACDFLHQGQNLQTAFRASFGPLPVPLETAMLCAQANGDLGNALHDQLLRWKATSLASHALIKSLIYPTVVMLMAIGCWIFLYQVSNPHLSMSQTPQTNKSDLANWLLGIGGITLLIALWARFFHQKSSRPRMRWYLPNQLWLISNFYHLIACELQAGLDLMHCLRYRNLSHEKSLLITNLNTNTVLNLNQMTALIQQQLKKGLAFSDALQYAKAPDFLIRQSKLAEQTGNLARCFFLASKVYEMQARGIQEKLQNVLPPIALALAALTLVLAYQFTLAPLYNNLTGL